MEKTFMSRDLECSKSDADDNPTGRSITYNKYEYVREKERAKGSAVAGRTKLSEHTSDTVL